MKYGICNLSIVPVRAEKSDTSELVTQVLYGEIFKVLDSQKKWSKIRLAFDLYEGWIDNKQYKAIDESTYKSIKASPEMLSKELIDIVCTPQNETISIVMGSSLRALEILQHTFDGPILEQKQQKSALISTALLYINTPYLWGGKTPFGIDCSGFTQMVYKLNGTALKRDASLQATQGEALSFIEESEPGDLAFFDNSEGIITHVGIILEDHYIIHAHGKVRIDRLDHTGIFNLDTKSHSHKLRVIKRIL